MIRILVVDDEQMIADSIYYLLLRQTQWQTEILRAYDSEEALVLAHGRKIDLLLTDICMPGKDGLALAREMRALWPGCHVLFLTGYQDFDYAYQALKLGGAQYILKTGGHAQLLEAIGRAVQRIDEERAENEAQTRLQAQVSMALSLMHAELFAQLLRGEAPSAALRERLSFPLDIGRPMALVYAQLPQNAESETQLGHPAKLVIHFLHRLLADRPVRWFYCEREDTLLCLFQAEPQAAHEIGTDFRRLVWESLAEAQALVEKETGHLLTFIMSGVDVPLAQLGELHSRMRQLAQSVQGRGAILRIDAEHAPLDAHGAVRYIAAYLQCHYADDISLHDLAELVHMDSTYLSRLFKREMGVTVIDHLNSVRVDAACRLLRDTFMKVADIAVATGFGTPKYFHVVFKRYTGMTPLAWRAANQAQSSLPGAK